MFAIQRTKAAKMAAGLSLLMASLGQSLWADSNIVGVPSNCRMKTIKLDLGKDSKGQVEVLIAGQPTRDQKADRHLISPDKSRALVVLETGFEIRYFSPSQRKPLKVVAQSFNAFDLGWDSSSQYLGFIDQLKSGDELRLVDSDAKAKAVRTFSKAKPDVRCHQVFFLPTVAGQAPSLVWLESSKAGNTRMLRKAVDKAEGDAASVILTHKERLDFMYVRPSLKEPMLIYALSGAASKGVYLYSFKSQKTRRLTDCKGQAITNLAWSPDGQHLALYIRRAQKTSKQGQLKGLVLFDLTEADEAKNFEGLSQERRLHSMMFSASGRYLTWAKESGCWYRRVKARGQPVTKVALAGKPGPIKGFAWDGQEQHLALTVGPEVWIYTSKTKASRKVYKAGPPTSHFLANPHWRDSQLIVTVYEDESMKPGRR